MKLNYLTKTNPSVILTILNKATTQIPIQQLGIQQVVVVRTKRNGGIL